jgi:hypothetical protein
LGVTFRNLDADKRYFPSVSRDAVGAFVALHPEPVRPRSEDAVPTPATKEKPIVRKEKRVVRSDHESFGE